MQGLREARNALDKGRIMTIARCIAIVDDDVAVREAVKGLLEAQGIATVAFRSAAALLAAPVLDNVSCVIADVRMPEISGPQLQQRLGKSHPGLPLIFMTAYADEMVRTRALTAGATAFLTKPFGESMLLSAIDLAHQADEARLRAGVR